MRQAQHHKTSEQPKKTGTLKVFFNGKGFGFIEQDNGDPDIFVHINGFLKPGGEPVIPQQFDRVSYETAPSPMRGHEGKTIATRVQIIERAKTAAHTS